MFRALAFTAAAGAVTLALTRASERGWTSPTTLSLVAAAVVAAVAFVAIEARSRQPVLELSLLRRPPFAGVLAAALLYSIAAFAYLTYESLWLQSVRGISPVQTGLALTPLAFSALIVSLAAGHWLHAVDARWRIASGLALIGAGAIAEAHLGAELELARVGARSGYHRDRCRSGDLPSRERDTRDGAR